MPDRVRRPLVFRDLLAVPPDVDRLIRGHRTVGNWSLGQILNHLSSSIQYTLSGFPGRHAPRLVQLTVGRTVRAVMFTTGRVARGVPLPAEYLPRPDLDVAREATSLNHAIAAVLQPAGPLHPHPLLGRLTHAQWLRFHAIHCAHHLSFAIVTSEVIAPHPTA